MTDSRGGSGLANRVLLRMYGRSVGWFRREYRLAPPETAPGLGVVEYVRKGLVVGVGGDVAALDASTALILGGPCIDHSGGNWNALTAQAVCDSWYALTLARDTNRPCLITIEDYEQSMSQGDRDACSRREWTALGARVASLVEALAGRLGWVHQTRVVCTSEPAARRRIASAAALLRPNVAESDYANVYRVNSAAARRDSPDTSLHRAHLRNWAVHLPEVACDLFGCRARPLIVAENLQQVRALERGRGLAARTAIRHEATTSLAVCHVAFATTPSTLGRIRMSRAPSEERLLVVDDKRELARKLVAAVPSSLEYWSAVIPGVWAPIGAAALAEFLAAELACARST